MKVILPLPLALLAAGCILEPLSEPTKEAPKPRPQAHRQGPAPEVPVIRHWPAEPTPVMKRQEAPQPTPAPDEADQPFDWPANGFPKRTPKGNHFIGPMR